MFGLGPVELFLAAIFLVIPTALIVVFVIIFLKLFIRMSRNLDLISRSLRNIEAKLSNKVDESQ